jgi:hypothetical protein
MRVVLDNCVDRRFARLIIGHEVSHALDHGWDSLTNGKLLAEAEAHTVEVLCTVDKNLRFQQNFANRKISLVVIEAGGIDLDSLKGFAEVVSRKLDEGIAPGSIVILTVDDLPT